MWLTFSSVALLAAAASPNNSSASSRRSSRQRASITDFLHLSTGDSTIGTTGGGSGNNSLGGGSTGDEVIVPPGTYNYAFSYTLPSSLPGSYTGRWGSIAYSARVTLERGWLPDIEKDVEFIVRAKYDLNEEPELVVSFKVGK